MATAAQRQAWRTKKRRQRGQGGQEGDKVLSRGQPLKDNRLLAPGYEVLKPLQAIVLNEDFPAAARVNAARTLAEMQGLIGRHQVEPDRATPSLSTLSRTELIAELEHLRTVIDLGLVR